MSVQQADTPLARYQQRLEQGMAFSDSGQAAAIKWLDDLFHQLMASAVLSSGSAGALSRLASFFTSAKSEHATPQGYYLYGGVGRGKTMLMNLFFECLPKEMGQRQHFHDFMVAAHAAIDEARKNDAADPFETAADILISKGRILCFDEMEVRDIADAMIVQRLFQALFARGLVMVATSNRHPDQLYLNGLHRDRFLPFIQLVQEKCVVREIAPGMDWRGRILADLTQEGERGWMVPCETAQNARLDALFLALAKNHPIAPEEVVSAGRHICVPKAARDIAFADFSELCALPASGQPLGARDYLVLADRYAGLVLKNVPAMGDAHQNEARRFMWLIDAFYDRGRFLIASAEADISVIYTGHQWAFEFERTRSRLGEMVQFDRS